jgi:hypothetical protein
MVRTVCHPPFAKRAKDGASSLGMVHAKIAKAGPPARISPVSSTVGRPLVRWGEILVCLAYSQELSTKSLPTTLSTTKVASQ